MWKKTTTIATRKVTALPGNHDRQQQRIELTIINRMKKQYLSPRMKVVKVQQTQIICGSVKSAFGVSNNGKVDAGSESDWSDENLGW